MNVMKLSDYSDLIKHVNHVECLTEKEAKFIFKGRIYASYDHLISIPMFPMRYIWVCQ